MNFYYLDLLYWALLNIDPCHRFNLININLLAIAPTEIIRNQGLDLLLDDFLETINELDESGINFTFNNQN